MEYWDLYDAERKPLGRTHLRGEKFEEGEFYVCCEVWVMNSKGEFLTTQRHPAKKVGGQWEFVGGGTLAGETTAESAVRELFEETGIVTLESELKKIATYAHKNYFQDIYLLKKDGVAGRGRLCFRTFSCAMGLQGFPKRHFADQSRILWTAVGCD